LGWLVEAAEHLDAVSRHFVHALDVEQVQMAELFAVLRAVKEGEVSEQQAMKRLARAPHWVWVALDPVCKLILAVDVGDRTLAMAQRLGHQVTQVLAPHCAPLVRTDGFREYLTALGTHDGRWMHPERRQSQGPQPKPHWMPLFGLLYAQVVKRYRRQRIVGGKPHVTLGLAATIESILAKRGWKINSSFSEHLNLDFRQHVAAIGRRVTTLCKHEAGLRQQLTLFHTYHNFVLPHVSLRLALPELEVVPSPGAIKRWQPRTPAMAAELTDRMWSGREVLMYRVPPWPQTQVE
jgi:IS1 family transposase